MKKIVFMFDIEGTLDNLSNINSKLLIEHLSKYKDKFNADEIILYLSTTYSDHYKVRFCLNLIKEHLLPGITVGKCFYRHGIYDYNTDSIIKKTDINKDKIKTLKEYYENDDVIFIGIIDDFIDIKDLQVFNNSKIVTLFNPSSYQTVNLLTHVSNQMLGYTSTLELLNQHYELIKDLSYEDILNAQQRNLEPLTEELCFRLFDENQYDIILRYLEEYNQIDEKYLNIFAEYINFNVFILNSYTEYDLIKIKKISELLIIKLNNIEYQENLKRVQKLQ